MSAGASGWTNPANEAEVLARAPIAIENDAAGSKDCQALLGACIHHGWTEPIPQLAIAECCRNNPDQQREFLESALHNSRYDSSISESIWNILVDAWPDVLDANLDHLATKAFEVGPVAVWEKLLGRLKNTMSAQQLVGFLTFLVGGGKTAAHNDLAQEALNAAEIEAASE